MRQSVAFPLLPLILWWAPMVSAPAADTPVNPEGVLPVPPGTSNRTELSLRIARLENGVEARSLGEGDALSVGEHMKVCFQTTRAGYITVWATGPDGHPARIYPNRFTEGSIQTMAVPVPGNEEVCIGDGRDFRLSVVEPRGENTIWLYWTEQADHNLEQDSFVNLDALSRSVRRESGSNTDNYADLRMTFQVR